MLKRERTTLEAVAAIATAAITAAPVLASLQLTIIGMAMFYTGIGLLTICLAILAYLAIVRPFAFASDSVVKWIPNIYAKGIKTWSYVGRAWTGGFELVSLGDIGAIASGSGVENQAEVEMTRSGGLRATTVFPDRAAVKAARGAKRWSQEDLAERSGVSVSKISQIERGEATSQKTIAILAEALDVDERRLLKHERTPNEPVRSEIEHFLTRNNICRDSYGEFIEVFSSPEGRGWKRSEVSHRYLGDYPCPKEFKELMQRFPVEPPNREYFGLHKCPPLTLADERKPVRFELYGGTWHHVSTLSKIFQNRFEDPDCRRFRIEFEDQWIRYSESSPLSSSPLYHNVNAETLVISSDGRLILGKRHERMLFGGGWSASIEEQMLRRDPDRSGRQDKHLFDAAERGVREELGVTVLPEQTALLKVGIEWGNFTAAFIFVVRCKETFREAVGRWQKAIHDPNEAVALDSIKATPASILDAASSQSYTPSSQWVQRVVVNKPQGEWHPTARARLHALAEYLEYLDE
jgi:transcriptional regulator with XRE-family HTH domain